MGTKREDETVSVYVDAVTAGANTAELVAAKIGQPLARVRKSLDALHNLFVLKREGTGEAATYRVRQRIELGAEGNG